MANGGLRWDPYLLCSGSEACKEFLAGYAPSGKSLLIAGRGFDPRMTLGLTTLLAGAPDLAIDCMLLRMDDPEAPQSSPLNVAADAHAAEIGRLITGHGDVLERQVTMSRREGALVKRIGGRKAADLFEVAEIQGYSDVIVDVSALPRGIYMSLIGKLLHIIGESWAGETVPPALFVFAAESASIDAKIGESLEEHAEYVTFFQGQMPIEGAAQLPKVWFPILGEGQQTQLVRLHEFIAPQEICPVLPMPSRDPRRADNLVRDYATLLFETWQVSHSNFIYVSEQNPFEAYRKLSRAVQHYRGALLPLGGSCKIVFSALSSKLLSIGALLAAYEFKMTEDPIAIAHVEAASYSMPSSSEGLDSGIPHLLMLSGEAYEL